MEPRPLFSARTSPATFIGGLALLVLSASWLSAAESGGEVDFNRDIRPILSNKCYFCHGPDEEERQGGEEGLRLDTRAGAVADIGGYAAVVPGQPDKSPLVERITSDDADQRMPPADTGKKLSPREVKLLTDWVRQGAEYAPHWSYAPPVRPDLPVVKHKAWPRNAIDYFVLARLEAAGLSPSEVADRYALARRVSLDLTGLPPTLEEVDRFVGDKSPDAYEKLVDRLLAKESYGEHWARMWLDLARYADSAGYADDPPRTIWPYRDYVIRAFNNNKRFDEFTVEQIAGDLLPDPTPDQLTATAFHRNTLTNNEGGTNDEEFRNVAIVDRVNTTMAVWMGTTIACAQCHTHKYDPLSQHEYFGLFAIFNNTADADRRDESPLLSIYSDEQKENEAQWRSTIAALKKQLETTTPESAQAQARWAASFDKPVEWRTLKPAEVKAKSGAPFSQSDDGSVLVAPPKAEEAPKTDVYTVRLSPPPGKITALRLETLTHESLPAKGPGLAGGAFVISQVRAMLDPPEGASPCGRYVRIEMPGKQKILSLAEAQIISEGQNIAPAGKATQSSTAYEGPAQLAIDGNTNGHYFEAKSTTHTAQSDNPWWEIDLGAERPIEQMVLWNRTDGGVSVRLVDFNVKLLSAGRETVWEQQVKSPPNPSRELSPGGARRIAIAIATADFEQKGFEASSVLGKLDAAKGWAVGPELGKPHALTLTLAEPLGVDVGASLTLVIEQSSVHAGHTLGRFRVQATDAAGASRLTELPAEILAIVRTPRETQSDQQRAKLTEYYRSIAPELKPTRDQLAKLEKQLASLKPAVTVPIMRERPENQRRTTHIQRRGNFLETGDEVGPGVPAAFHPLPAGSQPDRLSLAHWLVDDANPLTARVIANRYWEQIFGAGIVPTSEEFGSQGEPPTHPQLLDWLATELVRSDWDMKQFVRLLVTSAAYRQSSRVTPELLAVDPANQLLGRGPRFRISAEMIRDQALFTAGLLSDRMYGPPVKPPQPTLGVKAAFGGGIDWKTSAGEDRYRRGLYTTWRRSNPYPSMAAFDAPNREVCTIRRDRTNTPLQALVTMNDPVYLEAAQALARRMIAAGAAPAQRATHGFRICLARPPSDVERDQLVRLYEQAKERFAASPEDAKKIATQPLGPLPENGDAAEYAAWTLVGNVLLNLDEVFMKR
jgi:hypothetical protein